MHILSANTFMHLLDAVFVTAHFRCCDTAHVSDAVIFMHVVDAVICMHALDAVIFMHMLHAVMFMHI